LVAVVVAVVAYLGESDQMVVQVVDTDMITVVQRKRLVHLVKVMVVGEPVEAV
jgi:hypothetical protein